MQPIVISVCPYIAYVSSLTRRKGNHLKFAEKNQRPMDQLTFMMMPVLRRDTMNIASVGTQYTNLPGPTLRYVSNVFFQFS